MIEEENVKKKSKEDQLLDTFISEIRKLSEMSDEQIKQLLRDRPEIFEIIKQFNQLKLTDKSVKEHKFIDSGIDHCNLGYFVEKGCDY
jgi:hypothetical protein